MFKMFSKPPFCHFPTCDIYFLKSSQFLFERKEKFAAPRPKTAPTDVRCPEVGGGLCFICCFVLWKDITHRKEEGESGVPQARALRCPLAGGRPPRAA